MLCGWFGRILDVVEQPGVGVSHDNRAFRFSEPLDSLMGLSAALDRVAKANHPSGFELPKVGEDGVERKAVAMDVRNYCYSVHVSRRLVSPNEVATPVLGRVFSNKNRQSFANW